MIDFHLQADSEAALVAALPMLRGVAADGTPIWASGPLHALDVGIPIVTTPAVVDDRGAVTTPAVLDPRFHVNLRLDPAHPDIEAIQSAATAFVVAPHHPRRAFA